MSNEPPRRDPSAGGRPWLARPLKFTLCLTALCPLDCRPCYADCARRRGEGELDAATWLRLRDELADAGVINVFVEGGEPLARGDCEMILAHAARRMFTTLRTHAVSIDRTAERRLARLGLGRAKRDWASLALALADQRAALDSLIAAMPAGLRLMHSWHPNDANCCWQNAAIDPHGHAIGCPYLREFVDYGDLARVTWEETWAHPLYVRLRVGNVPVHCPDCAARELTAGGCRATAYAFHRSWEAPDPYCERMNGGVDLRVLPG